MPDALTEALAERLSRPPAETNERLQDFIADLKRQLREEGEVAIPNVGVFQLKNDQVTFEAASPLEHAINHRFAGLDPVQVPASNRASPEKEASSGTTNETPRSSSDDPFTPLDPDATDEELKQNLASAIMNVFNNEGDFTKPESSDSASSDDEDSSSGDVSNPNRQTGDESESEVPAPADEKRSPEEAATTPNQTFSDAPEDSGSESEDVESEYAETDAATPTSVGPDPAPEPDPTPKAAPDATGEPAEKASAPEDEATSSPSERAREHRPTRRSDGDSSNSSVFAWIVVLIILAVLGAGLWYYFQTANGDGASGQSAAPATGAAAPESQQQQSPSSPSESLPAYQPPAGLNAQEGGWTLVVASETSRQAAETTLRRYAEWFKRTDLSLGIVEGTVEGTTRYRVGVGQFDSQSEMQSALSRLQDRLPTGTWPLQLSK